MINSNLASRLPLVAILRGLEPDRAGDVACALVEAGFEIIEVPMNSPEPLRSIAAIVDAVGGRALVGAGTVLDVGQVDALAEVGARLVVSPNCSSAVVSRAMKQGMAALPGVLTPSEMFAAIHAGASGLKIFPAELVTPASVKAVRAVLPTGFPIFIVGGIHAGNMAEYLSAGATGFGIGGALFHPGKPVEKIAEDAAQIVTAFRGLVSAM